MTLDWRNIDTVLLDMDGTLLDLHFDTFFWLQHLPKRYAEQHNISVEKVTEQLTRRMTDFQGTLNWYCTDFWSEEFDLDILALKQEIEHLIGYRPHARLFLEALGTHNKQRVLVTNAHRDSVDLKFAITGLDAHLDSVISSHDYGQPKEDQQFWQQLQSNIHFDPQRTLFIDDSEAVLNSAEKYGIGHLLSIEQPDSQNPRRQPSKFPMLDSFAHLMTSDGLV